MDDGEDSRRKMLEAGAVPPVVQVAAAAAAQQASTGGPPPPALPHALRLLGGLARDKAGAAAIQEAGAVRPLLMLLQGPWGLGGAKQQARRPALPSSLTPFPHR